MLGQELVEPGVQLRRAVVVTAPVSRRAWSWTTCRRSARPSVSCRRWPLPLLLPQAAAASARAVSPRLPRRRILFRMVISLPGLGELRSGSVRGAAGAGGVVAGWEGGEGGVRGGERRRVRGRGRQSSRMGQEPDLAQRHRVRRGGRVVLPRSMLTANAQVECRGTASDPTRTDRPPRCPVTSKEPTATGSVLAGDLPQHVDLPGRVVGLQAGRVEPRRPGHHDLARGPAGVGAGQHHLTARPGLDAASLRRGRPAAGGGQAAHTAPAATTTAAAAAHATTARSRRRCRRPARSSRLRSEAVPPGRQRRAGRRSRPMPRP